MKFPICSCPYCIKEDAMSDSLLHHNCSDCYDIDNDSIKADFLVLNHQYELMF